MGYLEGLPVIISSVVSLVALIFAYLSIKQKDREIGYQFKKLRTEIVSKNRHTWMYEVRETLPNIFKRFYLLKACVVNEANRNNNSFIGLNPTNNIIELIAELDMYAHKLELLFTDPKDKDQVKILELISGLINSLSNYYVLFDHNNTLYQINLSHNIDKATEATSDTEPMKRIKAYNYKRLKALVAEYSNTLPKIEELSKNIIEKTWKKIQEEAEDNPPNKDGGY